MSSITIQRKPPPPGIGTKQKTNATAATTTHTQPTSTVRVPNGVNHQAQAQPNGGKKDQEKTTTAPIQKAPVVVQNNKAVLPQAKLPTVPSPQESQVEDEDQFEDTVEDEGVIHEQEVRHQKTIQEMNDEVEEEDQAEDSRSGNQSEEGQAAEEEEARSGIDASQAQSSQILNDDDEEEELAEADAEALAETIENDLRVEDPTQEVPFADEAGGEEQQEEGNEGQQSQEGEEEEVEQEQQEYRQEGDQEEEYEEDNMDDIPSTQVPKRTSSADGKGKSTKQADGDQEVDDDWGPFIKIALYPDTDIPPYPFSRHHSDMLLKKLDRNHLNINSKSKGGGILRPDQCRLLWPGAQKTVDGEEDEGGSYVSVIVQDRELICAYLNHEGKYTVIPELRTKMYFPSVRHPTNRAGVNEEYMKSVVENNNRVHVTYIVTSVSGEDDRMTITLPMVPDGYYNTYLVKKYGEDGAKKKVAPMSSVVFNNPPPRTQAKSPGKNRPIEIIVDRTAEEEEEEEEEEDEAGEEEEENEEAIDKDIMEEEELDANGNLKSIVDDAEDDEQVAEDDGGHSQHSQEERKRERRKIKPPPPSSNKHPMEAMMEGYDSASDDDYNPDEDKEEDDDSIQAEEEDVPLSSQAVKKRGTKPSKAERSDAILMRQREQADELNAILGYTGPKSKQSTSSTTPQTPQSQQKKPTTPPATVTTPIQTSTNKPQKPVPPTALPASTTKKQAATVPRATPVTTPTSVTAPTPTSRVTEQTATQSAKPLAQQRQAPSIQSTIYVTPQPATKPKSSKDPVTTSPAVTKVSNKPEPVTPITTPPPAKPAPTKKVVISEPPTSLPPTKKQAQQQSLKKTPVAVAVQTPQPQPASQTTAGSKKRKSLEEVPAYEPPVIEPINITASDESDIDYQGMINSLMDSTMYRAEKRQKFATDGFTFIKPSPSGDGSFVTDSPHMQDVWKQVATKLKRASGGRIKMVDRFKSPTPETIDTIASFIWFCGSNMMNVCIKSDAMMELME